MKNSNYYDVFDIIGPIMIGPSSSHTAGAVRIGLVVGQLCGYAPKKITVLFHGSLAKTYSNHKTDAAVVAGAMGIEVDNERIRRSVQIAEEKGIKVEFKSIELENAHPSTIIIKLADKNNNEFSVRAATIGGGNIFVEEINGYSVDLDGKQDCIVGLTEIADKPEFADLFKDVSDRKINIAKFEKKDCFTAFKIESDEKTENSILAILKLNSAKVKESFLIKAVMPIGKQDRHFYKSCKELVEKSKASGCLISDTVIMYESEKSGRPEGQVIDQMKEIYSVMKESIRNGTDKENELLGNIFKGNALKMNNFINSKRSICGATLSNVIRNALAVMEVNGSMGKVVACPTAGSAGTLPAAVITIAESNKVPEDKVIKALFTGAGIGIIIAENATISGAVGGCQAECGAASAISAAVITEMFGGDYNQVLNAVSLAFGNILGMVCDPVAGMVELPCIQRNAISAVNAVICAEMALAGVDSVIPADEMIGALYEVGNLMHCSLKDTLGAGISNTLTARRIEERFKKTGQY